MRNLQYLLPFLLITVALSCSQDKQKAERGHTSYQLESPNGKIEIEVQNADGKLFYSLKKEGEEILSSSRLGLVLKDLPSMDSNIVIKSVQTDTVNTEWEQVWGEQRIVKDHHIAYHFNCEEQTKGLQFELDFKLYDDGIGFRYTIPEQEGVDSIVIMDELTEFNIVGEPKAWAIPALTAKKYELLYELQSLKNLDTSHTPLTIEAKPDLYLSIHEAALKNYSSMTLSGNKEGKLKCQLVPWSDGTLVKTKGSVQSSWRTIQVGSKPTDLLASNIILNLNEPNKIEDVSWIRPMKYIGIWWGIHIGNWSFHVGPKLGATTENAKEHIDFAAKHGFQEVLVEGWNLGFEKNWAKNYGPTQDFTTPNPRYDMKGVQAYAKSKGVTIQAYNETCANPENYMAQIDSAYALYERMGYKSVKVGQVIVRKNKMANGEYHHGQFGVRYYQKVVEKAAEHKLCVNFHEPIKATGLRRTYPNLFSREGARGQEYNAWDAEGGNPPSHTCILPFTRMLSGPMDFTPGILRPDIPQKDKNQVNTTIAKQLALYVVLYSPMQMAADLIENYENNAAFQFIKNVPVDWETTKIVNGEIGQYITVARQERDGKDWYIGSITNEESRELELDLSFLEEGNYVLTSYCDNDKSNYKNAPLEFQIITDTVSYQEKIKVKLAPGGGAAIQLKKLK